MDKMVQKMIDEINVIDTILQYEDRDDKIDEYTRRGLILYFLLEKYTLDEINNMIENN